MSPITVVSQTRAIIHHKAMQRWLRVNYRESLDQLLLVMVRQISFDTITPFALNGPIMSKSSSLQNKEEREEENTRPGDASSQLNTKKGF